MDEESAISLYEIHLAGVHAIVGWYPAVTE